MKKFITSILGIFAGLSLFAQGDLSIVRTIGAGAVSNYLSGKYIIDSVRVINGNSSNTLTIKFYDWNAAVTSVVRSAYTTVSGYSTSYNSIYTNSAGIVATNTYKGWYTANTTVAAVTNEQSRLGEFQVSGGATRDLPFNPVVVRGLTALSDVAGTIEIVYSSIP